MKTLLSVVCENTAGMPLKILGEHGLSMLIERGRDIVLFDTGQGLGVISNAAYLGKDLSKVSCIALSHGHYDHTGGLAVCLEQAPHAKVVGHPDLFSQRFAKRGEEDGARALYIGIPFLEDDIRAKASCIELSSQFQEIAPGIFSTGEVPRPVGWKSWDTRLLVRDGEGWKPDPFRDDLSLLVETSKGYVLLLGCGHAGLHNIFAHLKERAGIDRLYAVVGGTHLAAADKAAWEDAVALFEDWCVEKIAVSHCTGFYAAAFLASHLGNRVVPAHAGTVLEF